MQFDYTAKTSDGLTQSGSLIAESLADARGRLRDQGLFALSVSPDGAKRRASTTNRRGHRASRVGKADVLMLTNQLSMMSEAGVDLGEALEIAAQQCENAELKTVLEHVHQDVSAGISVSEALRRHSAVFGDAYVASIAAGEASGTLTEVLARLAELLRHEMRLRSAIRSVVAYPVVLVGVAFVVISVLVLFVLPQFGGVFKDLGRQPPWHTQLLLSGAAFIRTWFPAVGGGALLLVAAIVKCGATDRAARYWDGVVLNFRILKAATRALLTGRTFRLLGTMMQSGIPLLEAIRLCRSSVKNRLYRRIFDMMEENVLNGGGIGEVMAASPLLPKGAAQMVATAERTGRLAPVMVSVGTFYEEEGEQKVKDLVKLLEPLIIIVMGVVVAGVVMAIMLPLLEVSTASS